MPTIGKYYLLEDCDNFTSFLRIIFVVFEIVSCVLFTFFVSIVLLSNEKS